MCVMKKIKDKFKLIRKDKSSAAFAVYFFVIIVLLVVQLVNCKEKDFDTYVFGTKTDELYEILDNKCIDVFRISLLRNLKSKNAITEQITNSKEQSIK